MSNPEPTVTWAGEGSVAPNVVRALLLVNLSVPGLFTLPLTCYIRTDSFSLQPIYNPFWWRGGKKWVPQMYTAKKTRNFHKNFVDLFIRIKAHKGPRTKNMEESKKRKSQPQTGDINIGVSLLTALI